MPIIKKHISEQDAFYRLSSKCALTEYCLADMKKMMMKWELPEGAEERILAKLLKDKYVDEKRYAHAFVRDKFRYNHWGLTKIEQQLRMKGISQDIIDDAKTEIKDEDNLESLKKIIEAKRKTVKGNSEYEINCKLFRFALSRGFSYNDISKVVKVEGD